MALNKEILLERAQKIGITNRNVKISSVDCDVIEFLLDNCEINIPKENRFFIRVNCAGIQNKIIAQRAEKYKEQVVELGLAEGEEVRAYTGSYDFNHTSTEWENVVTLGIYGLRKRVLEYAEKNSDESKREFYQNVIRVYDAALRFIKRASEVALSEGKPEMAWGLSNLSEHEPQNMFEALQTTMIYYVLQLYFDGTYLRTLGRLDQMLWQFFKHEEKEKIRELFHDYLDEVNSFQYDANIPFAIAGTDEEGNCAVNELSYLWLDVYRKAKTAYVKVHILCAENTPRDLLEQAFESVREGRNSIVFMSDKKIIESLEKLGESHEDAVNYHVVGCYECGGNNEITCSCNARVNIPKALELALNNGKDMLTGQLIGLEHNRSFTSFEELYTEFTRQLVHLCDCAMKVTDIYESHYGQIHSSPIFSGTYTAALEKGGDLYSDYAAKYNNSSVNALGLGTVTDALAAIRKLVFEDKWMTLEQLTEILKSDWKGQEQLRLLIKNKFPKFGVGDEKTDAIAMDIVEVLAASISGKPNAKGGVYRLGLFSLDWRWEFGERTAASADGRHAGETISQNTGASFGADKEGATAHLISASAMNASETPNGAVVDIDLHASSVRGQNGIKTLLATLLTYLERGGFAVQYNILDTEILKEAKLNPEKYPNLQVRLCGWNVLFSSLSDKEKDEFIARSIKG